MLRARGDANVPFAMQSLEIAAPQLGVRLQTVDIASADKLDTAFAEIARGRAQALVIIAGSLTFVADARIASLALAVPTRNYIRQY